MPITSLGASTAYDSGLKDFIVYISLRSTAGQVGSDTVISMSDSGDGTISLSSPVTFDVTSGTTVTRVDLLNSSGSKLWEVPFEENYTFDVDGEVKIENVTVGFNYNNTGEGGLMVFGAALLCGTENNPDDFAEGGSFSGLADKVLVSDDYETEEFFDDTNTLNTFGSSFISPFEVNGNVFSLKTGFGAQIFINDFDKTIDRFYLGARNLVDGFVYPIFEFEFPSRTFAYPNNLTITGFSTTINI